VSYWSTAQALLDAETNNGGTFIVRYDQAEMQFSKVQTDYGYYVSQADGIDNIPTLALSVDLLEGFAIHWDIYSDDYTMLGLWKNPETELWSLDRTVWTKDIQQAERLAVKHSQVAFWDCHSQDNVMVMVGPKGDAA
jgi:hypothetical protein